MESAVEEPLYTRDPAESLGDDIFLDIISLLDAVSLGRCLLVSKKVKRVLDFLSLKIIPR